MTAITKSRGRLVRHARAPGSRVPDWEGYLDVDGRRYQLVGWSNGDAINVRVEGSHKIITEHPADEKPPRSLPSVKPLEMYRR